VPPLPDDVYYASLPRKAMSAGALIRDQAQRILLVEPTYKDVWEIPGGIVEADEAPLRACIRELREELGITRAAMRLLCVDYARAAAPKPEMLAFVFDGGVLSASEIANIALPEAELRSYRFVTPEELVGLMAQRTERRALAALRQLERPGAVYLEDQEIPDP
jgi:ADP-ribose pyrophosphatase YjhB (NUDIX family)